MVSGAEQDFVPNPTLVTLVLAYVSTPKKNRLETTEASTLLLYGACFFSEDLLYRRFKKSFLSEERVGTGGDRKVRAVVTAPCDVSPISFPILTPSTLSNSPKFRPKLTRHRAPLHILLEFIFLLTLTCHLIIPGLIS